MAFLLARLDLVEAANDDALAKALQAQTGIRAVRRLVPDFVVPSAGCAIVLHRAGPNARTARVAIELLRGFKMGILVVVGSRINDPETYLAHIPDAVQMVVLPDDPREIFVFLVRIAQRVHSSKLHAAKSWIDDERTRLAANVQDARMQAVLNALPIDRGEAHALADVFGSAEVLARMSVAEITARTPLSQETASRIIDFFARDEALLH